VTTSTISNQADQVASKAGRIPAGRAGAEGKKQMIKPKRSAEQQVTELERRALHPLSSRQTISDSQAEPEFHANHKCLRAERLAREAVEIGLRAKAKL
jgi:hypothetical protein